MKIANDSDRSQRHEPSDSKRTPIGASGSQCVNHRQFKMLFEDLDSEYKDVLYYNQVRWLSLGQVLHRVWAIKNKIILFLEIKYNNFPELADQNWLCDFEFTLDIMTHLNVFNSVLQKKMHMLMT